MPSLQKPSYRIVDHCRICRSDNLTEWLDLGNRPLANAFLKPDDVEKPEPRYPLRVLFCETCGLSQLGEVVHPEILFRDYVYFSSGMPHQAHFAAYAKDVQEKFLGGPGDLVVEIGSNDGHLLSAIKQYGARTLGVDPAKNIAAVANERGIETIPDFFSRRLAEGIVSDRGRANVIIGNNVVAHIDDHHDFMQGIDAFLADDGVFIFEAPHIMDMVRHLAFDSIYHEHLSYVSLRPLARLFENYGFEVFDVILSPVQGNYSLRGYVGRKGKHPLHRRAVGLAKQEQELELDRVQTYQALAQRIARLRTEVVELVRSLAAEGRIIGAYGAPARGNTLLNFFGLDHSLIRFATEELPSKIGLVTPGAHIPVVDITWARKNPPDYYFLLAWPYRDIIFEKERVFRERGGKFIMPVGEERIL